MQHLVFPIKFYSDLVILDSIWIEKIEFSKRSWTLQDLVLSWYNQN